MADDVLNTLIAEAYAEGPEGMRRVAETILNRAAIRGITPEEVVRQARQYTGYENPGPSAVQAQQSPRAQAAAQAAWQLAQQPGDPTGGADHYFNPNVVQPSWASSMTPTGQYQNHAFFSSRPVPPGELPEVGTLQDTRRTPSPVAPVTATPDMAMMRRAAAPSQLIPDTFSRLPRPSSANVGDQLAMSPVQGGTQQAPMFDAGFDERLGAMRPLSTPMDTQGMFTARSAAPPPVPAQMSAQMSGRRATDPVLQAALDARYRPQVSASDLARGRSGISTVASYPATGVGQPPATRAVQSVPVQPRPSIPQSYAGMDRGAPRIPDRLLPDIMAGARAVAPPALPGPYSSATLSGAVNPLGQRIAVADASPVPGAPYPFPRPNFMPQVATQLATTPLPPLPRRVAPVPMPFEMRPAPPTNAPLRITVNGGNVQQPAAPRLSPQQAYDAANRAAAQRARANASSPSHQSTSSWFNEVTGR